MIFVIIIHIYALLYILSFDLKQEHYLFFFAVWLRLEFKWTLVPKNSQKPRHISVDTCGCVCIHNSHSHTVGVQAYDIIINDHGG